MSIPRGQKCVYSHIHPVHRSTANLERQFGILREQLYCERINQVDTQLADIRNGRSQEYLGPLQELNENLRTRTEVASVLRRLQTENIQHKFDSEELAALQHFEVCIRPIRPPFFRMSPGIIQFSLARAVTERKTSGHGSYIR